MGHFLTATTIHISLIGYLLAVVCWITGRRNTPYRILWTMGCLFLFVHAMCAFHFYLNWSNAEAIALTAQQTEEIVGVRFGNGIYFSYLLIAIWAADVALVWRDHISKGYEFHRSTWFSYVVHAYAFFILFNGTVVFESGAVQLGGLIGTIWLARLLWRFRKHRFPAPEPRKPSVG